VDEFFNFALRIRVKRVSSQQLLLPPQRLLLRQLLAPDGAQLLLRNESKK
jgi:hypothetical protein